ncbi:hypothetical protein [Zunongwangia pacifica]|uniref:Uncharacterized protein n=1 Tax=Zunongwangia pacifica TaxID=2911062 RepID=A0A9X2CR54_9FLAO|nr:hypothetical protein [Zunongwangia pacifica]MCL6220938.1 hypothetical protein [Zunongwangia pacifica]
MGVGTPRTEHGGANILNPNALPIRIGNSKKLNKMKKYIILFCVNILCFGCITSQSNYDNLNNNKVLNVIEKSDLKDSLKSKPYLLFSIKDKWYHIIIKNDTVLEEYSITVSDNNKVSIINRGEIKEPKNFLFESFNPDIYHKECIDLNSKFYVMKSQMEILLTLL